MLVVLYPENCSEVAATIASDLTTAYFDSFQVELMPASVPTLWPNEAAWDDLLLVLFDDSAFPDAGQRFIEEQRTRLPHSIMVLPGALSRAHQLPPRAVADIKAIDLDATATGSTGRLARRIGAMLGLRVQSRDNRIFISYRTADGGGIAGQLYDHLESLGYDAWRDQARELDGEPKILPGSPVQKEIDDALTKTNLILLVDTPLAPQSGWMRHEIETANSLLLPVLPLCIRFASDPRQGPRFRSLLELQRWVTLPVPNSSQAISLNHDQLHQVVSEMESYLAEIFRRQCRIPFLVEKEFVSKQFAWRVLDQRLLMFESTKQLSWRVPIRVLSHCSPFEQVHTPGLRKLADFFASNQTNHALFIYGGELIPEMELEEISQTHQSPAIILHHQELAALIDSNFTNLAS